MFAQNICTTDRIIRIVVGVALLAGFFLHPEASLRSLYLLGIIPLATGLLRTCPLYSILGVNTCTRGRK